MTAVSGKRRGRGEDSIYRDATKSCYVGAVSLGYSPSGTRIRKRVMAQTKTEVREKLKELHQQAANGVRPRRHYTVNDALDDWLETGLDGLAGRPSKSLTFEQAVALMAAAQGTRLEAYVILSLLSGVRTEEARALPSCRCCRLGGSRWRRSRCWLGTTRPRRPNWCTGTRSCPP
jgi:hypothetical protein